MPDDVANLPDEFSNIAAAWDESISSAPDIQDDAPSHGVSEGIVPLGHDRGVYYYLSRATGQVEGIPADRHSRGMLTHLASEARYWQRTQFMGKKEINWYAAADWLRGMCRDVGIYDPDRVRGRGAWLDNNRSVLHLGDKLVVDGIVSGLDLPDSHYVYEHAQILPAEIGLPLPSSSAARLMELCMAAPWEAPQHMGRLLAGWCVIAPVCGAMPWRPHLWITSEHGGGKTWLLDNVVRPLIGSVALEVASKTTEAGIRQKLVCDARPVVFDEAETQNDQDRARVQLVLDLARQASSEDGAAIIKGSSNGRASLFRIRSCFAFSSINVGMSQAADESRTVILSLALSTDAKQRAADFAKLQALHADIMRPGFAAGLLARTLSLLPAIRANATVFAEAIARSGQTRRTGDTYGVLLAGAWSLRSRALATPEEADAFIKGTDWVQQAVKGAKTDPEWQRALGHLMQHRERVTGGNSGPQDVPIGELVEIAAHGSYEGCVARDTAVQALNRIGLKVTAIDPVGDCLAVKGSSQAIAKIFEKTAWSVGWLATIARATGAKRDAANLRLAGSQGKVLAVPLKHATGDP